MPGDTTNNSLNHVNVILGALGSGRGSRLVHGHGACSMIVAYNWPWHRCHRAINQAKAWIIYLHKARHLHVHSFGCDTTDRQLKVQCCNSPIRLYNGYRAEPWSRIYRDGACKSGDCVHPISVENVIKKSPTPSTVHYYYYYYYTHTHNTHTHRPIKQEGSSVWKGIVEVVATAIL